MTSHYYGPLRLEPSAPVLMQWATVSPLPSPTAPSPRRRRVFVCPHLRIDNEPVATFRPRTAGGGEITTAYCAQRHVGITGSFVVDLCGSSFSRECPFLPEKEQAA